jgi:hypothetical protein
MVRVRNVVPFAATLIVAAAVCAADAQPPVARPQPPPPAPGSKAPAKPGPTAAPTPAPATEGTGTKPSPTAVAPASRPQPAAAGAPPAACQQGAPVMAGAQYLESYDAGMGQSFCLYGSTQTFTEVVMYYRTVLKDRGELVFDVPATHMFEVGRFKENEVAFPPGVTVKDYTSGGSPGYMNPRLGATPAFFPTVIQIVPPPPTLAGRRD